MKNINDIFLKYKKDNIFKLLLKDNEESGQAIESTELQLAPKTKQHPFNVHCVINLNPDLERIEEDLLICTTFESVSSELDLEMIKSLLPSDGTLNEETFTDAFMDAEIATMNVSISNNDKRDELTLIFNKSGSILYAKQNESIISPIDAQQNILDFAPHL